MSDKNTAPTLIHVVYPSGHSGGNHQTYEDRVLVMGHVKALGGTLWLQNRAVALSPAGYFCTYADLKTGSQSIVLSLKKNGQLIDTRTIQIKRPAPLSVLKSMSVRTNAIQSTTMMPGESVQFKFSASPQDKVSLLIPGVLDTPLALKPKYPNAKTVADGYIDNREMVFAEPHQMQPLIPKAGWYEVVAKIPADAAVVQNVPMQLHLSNGAQQRLVVLPGKLSVWHRAKVATTKTDRAICRLTPDASDRLSPLRSQAELMIDGLWGDWARIRLAPNDTAWVKQTDVSFNQTPPPPYALVTNLSVQSEKLNITTPHRLPMQFSGEPQRLIAHLYGATAQCAKQIAVSPQSTISSVNWQQLRENVMSVTIQTNGYLSGYDYGYDASGIVLSVKTLPTQLSDSRVLIDPGHGGAELGSVGPSGLAEKNLNLAVSKKLKAALQKVGFKTVLMTRETDVAVSLEARAKKAIETQADIVLSIHHNALPDGRDPARYEGACSFYYHPFSQPLAEAMQRAFVRGAGMPDFGVMYNNLAITRIHQAMSVLLELGFFTHPAEYERLINPAFQDKVVAAMAKELAIFCARK